PTIAAADAETQFARASLLKQEAYQRWLVKELPTDAALAVLEEAIALDSGKTSIACLLALANEGGWQQATDAIARHVKSDHTILGFELFAKKVTERRSFFSADEVATLRASGVMADRYMVALDQVFRATDDQLETTAALAQEYLEEAL